jgi:bHLH factor
MAIDNALLQHQQERAHLQSQATEAFHQYQLRQQQPPSQGAGAGPQRYDPQASNAGMHEMHGGNKPTVGSDEWHRLRKDSHKEVEKRRRQNINRGIEELKKIVPDCDKHKGQILKNAVEYIKKLKENEQQNIEKLTLEKLLTEQAIAELSASNKALKAQLAQAWKEVEHWKHLCGELSKGKDLPLPPQDHTTSA